MFSVNKKNDLKCGNLKITAPSQDYSQTAFFDWRIQHLQAYVGLPRYTAATEYTCRRPIPPTWRALLSLTERRHYYAVNAFEPINYVLIYSQYTETGKVLLNNVDQ